MRAGRLCSLLLQVYAAIKHFQFRGGIDCSSVVNSLAYGIHDYRITLFVNLTQYFQSRLSVTVHPVHS